MNFKKYKLKDLVDNFSVRARDYGGSDGLEFLGVSNDDGVVKSKSAAEHKGEEYKIIEKGCFAYNPYRINIGSIAYHNEDVKGLISPAYVIFKTKPNSIKDNLLFKFLKSAEGLRQIRFHGRGTVRQALRFEDLCKIEISLPSYEEQENLISSIEKTEIESNLISLELNHQLNLIKQLRQAFLHEAMQGKIVKSTNSPATGQQLLEKIKAEKEQLIKEKKLKKEKGLVPITEDEIPFEIPEHWTWCRLGELADIVRGGSPRPAGDLKYYHGNIPFLKVGDLTGYEDKFCTNHSFTIKEAGLHKTRFVDENTLMLTNSGATLGIPRICTFSTTFNDGIAAFLNLNHIDKIFLYYFLKYKSDWFLKQASRGQGQPNLNTDIIGNTLFALPPLHEQEQIVAKLEELMAFCDGLEQSIKESQAYNKLMSQQVLREALQPKTETKVVTIESRKLALPLKTILGAHIIDVCNTTDFGRVKFQKLLFLTEYHCKIDFESDYVQKTAGPHDDALIKGIESEFKRQRFFEVKQENSDLHRVRYTKLPNANQINSMFLENFNEESLKVNNLLMKMRTFNWEECEVIATIYAAWNNRLLKGQTITDESLFNDFMAWSSRKSNFSKDFYKKLFWMKEENIIPDGNGWGNYIDKPDKKMA